MSEGYPLVTTRADSNYVLLQPGTHLPRTGPTYQFFLTPSDISQLREHVSRSRVLVVDFETRGDDYSLPIPDQTQVVGIGLAWDTGSCYTDCQFLSQQYNGQYMESIWQIILSHPRLVAHNVYFDGGYLFGTTGSHGNWHACTYALTAQLANESPEQRWGLKHLMTSVLGWESSNEDELDWWLISNGYHNCPALKDRSEENLRRKMAAPKSPLLPDKSQMWRAPVEILGKYCCLDVEATYLLYTEVLAPVAARFPGLLEHHARYMHLVRLLIEQKTSGILVDRLGLIDRATVLRVKSTEFLQQFCSDNAVRNHIVEIEAGFLQEHLAKEPARLKKDGDISKNWLRWDIRRQEIVDRKLPEYLFNLNSDQQMVELLHTRLGMEVTMRTETGIPSMSNKALGRMGDLTAPLIEFNYVQKELGYIQDYIDRTENRPTIHPSFRCPGTITDRLSSKEPNLQQIPKSKAVMSLWKAFPGEVWVDIDFAALESVVAAEFSQDPNLLALYSDSAPENDIHLFVASKVPGEFGRRVLATGYTPINPIAGSVSRAKKECKKERSIAKTTVYACQFGAGINKVMEGLEAEGVFLEYEEVAKIHGTYWSTFAGLKDFARSLEYEWKRNGGYILNGMGRPMCVSEDYKKDVLNRFIQSTGHDLLVMYIEILTRELDNAGIPWRPVIIDWHDASTVGVPVEYEQPTIDVMNYAMDLLNDKLRGIIQHRGKPTSGTDLAAIKEPEE